MHFDMGLILIGQMKACHVSRYYKKGKELAVDDVVEVAHATAYLTATIVGPPDPIDVVADHQHKEGE